MISVELFGTACVVWLMLMLLAMLGVRLAALVLGVAVLGGCAWMQASWHGCNGDVWRGWESERACVQLRRQADITARWFHG